MGVDVGHGVSIVRIEHCLLQLCLDQGEEHVREGEGAAHEVALPFQVVVRQL